MDYPRADEGLRLEGCNEDALDETETETEGEREKEATEESSSFHSPLKPPPLLPHHRRSHVSTRNESSLASCPPLTSRRNLDIFHFA